MMDDKKSATEAMPPPSLPDDNDDEEMTQEDKLAIERAGNKNTLITYFVTYHI